MIVLIKIDWLGVIISCPPHSHCSIVTICDVHASDLIVVVVAVTIATCGCQPKSWVLS